MDKLFRELRERLLRAGVAPRHVRRYLKELADHFADLSREEQRAGHSRADAEGAALLRLGTIDQLAEAMIRQRQLQAWSAQAPWAMFGLAPVAALAVAYFVACFILWSGWQMFLPGTETPFIRQDNPYTILYFAIGRNLYFTAPILVGWGIALLAIRQRLKLFWPAVGLVLLSLIGSSARVHASGVAPGVPGHVSMDLALRPLAQGISANLTHAIVILSLTLLPCLFWRVRQTRTVSE